MIKQPKLIDEKKYIDNKNLSKQLGCIRRWKRKTKGEM
jgi:hypothetical protein